MRPHMFVFFQAEDGIRDLVRSRGLGDVYKRQLEEENSSKTDAARLTVEIQMIGQRPVGLQAPDAPCLLYTSDAADERSSVDLGGRRIIKKNTQNTHTHTHTIPKRTVPYTDRHCNNDNHHTSSAHTADVLTQSPTIQTPSYYTHH